jgi:hypothetical protein
MEYLLSNFVKGFIYCTMLSAMTVESLLLLA